MSLDELKNKALQLLPGERAKLAHVLLSSLEDLSLAEIETLWIDEAIRRDEEIDSGTVELRSADHVINEVRSRRK